MKIKQPSQNYTNLTKTRSPPTPPKQKYPVSSLEIIEQERVKETSLVIGRVTAVVAVVAGGGQEAERAERAEPGGTAANGE